MTSAPPSRPASGSTRSSTSQHSRSITRNVRQTPPPAALTPDNSDLDFEPCAATASCLLYAQGSTILVLHHDTLTIERRLQLHNKDVKWIAVDNVSEKGAGRLGVSFDAGKQSIVWDMLTGDEIARFSAYEDMRVASFMRNGNIAFGNDQGNVILFEPSTSEHLSARTIFDPITAIAPSADCRTFAIGYLNGSILIATLSPSFTILHTLNTTKAPSKITGLAWHGSSSKQRTDMLATQTQDGDLRVWSVPKDQSEVPNIIRVLQRSDVPIIGPSWFSWSKNGRLLQLADGEARSWDVRTKRVTYDVIPTIEGVTGIACHGPSAVLFTLGRNHTVQQYDVSPSEIPSQVAQAQHAPANTPPTPPVSLQQRRPIFARDSGLGQQSSSYTESDSSADEGALSPMDKIRREMDSLDSLESELRDKVMPLSPRSSKASSVSSRGSGNGRRRQRKYLYDAPGSSAASATSGYDGTEFSFGVPSRSMHDSISVRSTSSAAPQRLRMSNFGLRGQITPQARATPPPAQPEPIDLFPCTKQRLAEAELRTPHYGDVARTPELLQREMLSVVFGWNDDVRGLINDELTRHRPGSANAVLLSRWLGEIGADDVTAMIGSESMTSSDWMLLALSSLGNDSKKKAGEAFVQRLLEKGDIHPAVAILLGLGEIDDAIEVYASHSYWTEAVLLTCLMCPTEWRRVSQLLKQWGEAAVLDGRPELAVRCLSCTSVQSIEPWSSQQAGAIADAQKDFRSQVTSPIGSEPAFSPMSRTGSGRLKQKNAALKLITSFGDKGAPIGPSGGRTATLANPGPLSAVTPIGASALPTSALPTSPGGTHDPWRQSSRVRPARDASAARTATPGGYTRRKRLPSRSDIDRAKQEAAELATPLTAARDAPLTAVRPSNSLPSPAPHMLSRLRDESRSRGGSRDLNKEHLEVQIVATRYRNEDEAYTETVPITLGDIQSPPLTSDSRASNRGRAHEHVNSVDEARFQARAERAESRRRTESRKRGESKSRRASSRHRDASEAQHRAATASARYITPARRSPSSPVPMSPEEVAEAAQPQLVEPATTDDESFYKNAVASPVESQRSGRSNNFDNFPVRRSTDESAASSRQARSSSKPPTRTRSPDRLLIPGDSGRGRSEMRSASSAPRSPSLPLPGLLEKKFFRDEDDDSSIEGRAFGQRSRSASRKPADDLQSRRQAKRTQRERSNSLNPRGKGATADNAALLDQMILPAEVYTPGGLSKKAIAATQLAERRKSLAARRPSAPAIPLPGEGTLTPGGRPNMLPRAYTDLGDSPNSMMPPLSRSQSVDPEAMARGDAYAMKVSGTSTTSVPIGLPATPRAMRHTKYMNADPNERERGGPPPVPDIPGKFSDLGSYSGSALSQVTGSNLSQTSSSFVKALDGSKVSGLSDPPASMVSEYSDGLGPLLPSTTYGQKVPPRAASAPPEKMVHPMYKTGLSSSNTRSSHVRKISPPDVPVVPEELSVVSSIDAALHGGGNDNQIVVVTDDDRPIVLPELQHLANPMPPPPPPLFPGATIGSGMISIAMDDFNHNGSALSGSNLTGSSLSGVSGADMLPPAPPVARASTVSPSMHRRQNPSTTEGLGSRIRGISDRMRSSSRNRTRAPTIGEPAPYETVLPPMPTGHVRRTSLSSSIPPRVQSPYEQAMAAAAAQHGQQQQTLPSTSYVYDSRISETAVPPSSLPGSRAGSTVNGYRNPREVRANMPPEHIQHGVYGGGPGFL